MLNQSALLRCALVSALLLGLVPVTQARELYRYYNDEGNLVVNFKIPVEYASRGYEVVNDKGVVIRVVPRELSAEEQEVQDAQLQLEARAMAEQERLRKWDESLLLRYSTVADIEDARERALQDIRIRVSIHKSHKRSLKQQVENYQKQAANLERLGQEVDAARLATIEQLQAEIATTDRAISDRQQEIHDVGAAYQQDIERFEMLLEIVELRRTLLVHDRKEQQGRSADPRSR